MATYTLHLPDDARPGDAGALDDAVLVRDGFSWGAFVLSGFWLFLRGSWLAGIGALAATVGLSLALRGLRIDPAAAALAQLALALLIGFEAASLRRWTLRRWGRPAVAAIVAENERDAETKAFSRWLQAPERQSPRPAAPLPPYRAEPVIGLFPDTEGRR